MPVWSDEQLIRWMKDGEEDVVAKVYMRLVSFSIEITSGVGTYDLNHRIYRPIELLWKGQPLSPYIGREIHAIEPNFRTVQGRPTAYQMFGDGVSTLRLIPVPNESIQQYDTGLEAENIENAFIIRAFVFPDNDVDYFQIPDYVFRNLIKCYVLHRAFNAEGIGQNLKGAQYWQRRYNYYLGKLVSAKAKFFNGKEGLDDSFFFNPRRRRHARLPNDFTISKPVFRLQTAFSDSFSLSDLLQTELDVDPSVLQEDFSDNLDAWDDELSVTQVGHISLARSDDLDNWSDSASANTGSAVDLPALANLVLDYRIDEGSGQVLTDSSGNGHDGQLGSTGASGNDDPDWATDGGETILDFDITNPGTSPEFIDIPDITAEFSGSGTMLIVLKKDEAIATGSGWGRVWQLSSHGGSAGFEYYVNNDGNIYVGALSTARKSMGSSASISVVDVTDWHVVMITSTANDWKFYQNTTQIYTTNTNTFGFPANALLGCPSSGSLHGQIARFVLWNKVLDSSEREQAYEAVKAAKSGLGLP